MVITRDKTSEILFQPAQVGNMYLKHRIVVAPVTRKRVSSDHVPYPIVLEHYAQRASTPGTLIVTEGTLIAHQAGGYAHVPGIWNNEQIARWKEVTTRVHDKGSYMFLQLWALGRTAIPGNPDYEPGFPYDHVSASNIPVNPNDDTAKKPRPLSVEEIQEYVGWYVIAAKNAVFLAGCDGVEVHCAGGYLIDQFLQDVSNDRTDEYGGSIENRARFALQVIDAVVQAVGAERTGIRLSPWMTYNGMRMKDPKPTFRYLVQQIKNAHPTLSYISIFEPLTDGFSTRDAKDIPEGEDNDFIREIWTQEGSSRWYIGAGGYTRTTALQIANKNPGELIAFGKLFAANPDLPYRLKHDLPLNEPDFNTLFVPNASGPEGYTDYPFAK